MSFFSELPGKRQEAPNEAYAKILLQRLSSNIQTHVRNTDAQGKRQVRLLVVYNDYDNDIYSVLASKHKEMETLLGKHLKDVMIPSKKGSFGMEDFPIPVSRFVKMIEENLVSLGSKYHRVSIVIVPTYGHPDVGIFDKRLNTYKLVQKGSCETIEIDLKW